MSDTGKLLLRLALGLLILLHGIAKIRDGIEPITGMVTGAGLPAFVAYGVYVGEVVAPLLVLAGWYARVGGALIAVNMLVAVALAHAGQLAMLSQTGGWQLELQGMYFCTAVAIALLGPGRYGFNDR